MPPEREVRPLKKDAPLSLLNLRTVPWNLKRMPREEIIARYTATLDQTRQELTELYRELAQEEGIELVVRNRPFPFAEFRVCLSSALVLMLVEYRKRLGGSRRERPTLSEVMEHVLEAVGP